MKLTRKTLSCVFLLDEVYHALAMLNVTDMLLPLQQQIIPFCTYSIPDYITPWNHHFWYMTYHCFRTSATTITYNCFCIFHIK
jgi:hypothetical protein